jgi:nicotinate-nucleotide adenylyltransferase
MMRDSASPPRPESAILLAGGATAHIGILGGMFNPPHLGHLALARAAVEDLGLERVLLTPVLVPPHKPAKWDPGAEHRLQMCRLLTHGDPHVGVCTLELERPGPSYTVDTLRSIHASQPEAELTLIVGADVARTLGSWRRPQEILGLARLAVAERDGSTRQEVIDGLAPLGCEILFLTMPRHEISSTLVRRRVASGEPIEELVGTEVAGYISEHDLYGRRPAAPESPAAGGTGRPGDRDQLSGDRSMSARKAEG